MEREGVIDLTNLSSTLIIFINDIAVSPIKVV